MSPVHNNCTESVTVDVTIHSAFAVKSLDGIA